MEIKLTADKKLLEALDKLAETFKPLVAALGAQEIPYTRSMIDAARREEEKDLATYETEPAQPAALDPMTALPVVKDEPDPQQGANEPAQSVPNREDVQRVAVTKIQSKLGAKVKALIEKHGGTRVSDVPEENLAAFLAELEALA